MTVNLFSEDLYLPGDGSDGSVETGEATFLRSRTGVTLPSLTVSWECRRLKRGEECQALRVFSLNLLRLLGVEGASPTPTPTARRCSTGVWMPTDRVLGAGDGGGVPVRVSWDEVEDRSVLRRRGKGDRASCRNDAITAAPSLCVWG